MIPGPATYRLGGACSTVRIEQSRSSSGLNDAFANSASTQQNQ